MMDSYHFMQIQIGMRLIYAHSLKKYNGEEYKCQDFPETLERSIRNCHYLDTRFTTDIKTGHHKKYTIIRYKPFNAK